MKTEDLPPRRDRVAREYGTATTDPLGREGPGWHINPVTLLPTRDSRKKKK